MLGIAKLYDLGDNMLSMERSYLNARRAAAATSALFISLGGTSFAEAGAPAQEKHPAIHDAGRINYLHCEYEKSPKFTEEGRVGVLGVLRCKVPQGKTIWTLMDAEKPNGHVFILHGHGENHPKLIKDGDYRWMEETFPERYIAHLLKQGDHISFVVHYSLNDPTDQVSQSDPEASGHYRRSDLGSPTHIPH